MRPAVYGHMAFFHDLQQRRLRFAGRAVDLVGQQQIAHDRALDILEFLCFLVVQGKADHVRRHRVRGELDALIIEPQRLAEGERERRFSRAGYVFKQHMAAGQHGHQHFGDGVVFAKDNLSDFAPDLSDDLIHFPVSFVLFSFVWESAFFFFVIIRTTAATAITAITAAMIPTVCPVCARSSRSLAA